MFNSPTRVKYQRTRISLQEYPYVTNCRNYMKEDLVNPKTCIEKCMFREESRQDALTESSRIYEVSDLKLKKWDSINRQIVDTCFRRCAQTACYIEQYRKIVEDGGKTTINIYFPQEPDFIVNYLPKTQFVEFLVIFCSLFGFWFGLSVTSLSKFAIR